MYLLITFVRTKFFGALLTSTVRQVWLVDDAIGAGCRKEIGNWWNELSEEGSLYGYYVNETKSWMILKHGNKLTYVQTMFKETNINFITEGKRYLGVAVGSKNFCDEYASGKVSDWCDELDRVSEIQSVNPKQPIQHLFTGKKESPTIS